MSEGRFESDEGGNVSNQVLPNTDGTRGRKRRRRRKRKRDNKNGAKRNERAEQEPLARDEVPAAGAGLLAADAAPATRSGLLDAEAARRLADAARSRERASRAALERTRAILDPAARTGASERANGADPGRDAPRPLLATEAAAAPSGWRTRPLAPERAADESDEASTPDRPTDALRVARGTIRELKATLAIAREASVSQRAERAHLRARVEELESQQQAAHSDRREVEHLRERLARQAREAQQAERTRGALETELTRVRGSLVEREDELARLYDRLREEHQALAETRRALAIENERHAESRALLGRLKTTLEGVSASTFSNAHADTSTIAGAPAGAHRQAVPETTQTGDATDPRLAPPSGLRDRDAGEPERTETDGGRVAAVFDLWQDEQLRRNLGPLGIEGFADLVRSALERRDRPVLLQIGRRAWIHAHRLAEQLLEAGAGAFTIHVADPDASCREGSVPADSPLRERLSPIDFPADPRALRRAIEACGAEIVVCRDFLSDRTDVDPWLDVLVPVADTSGCLILCESTGHDVGSPPEDVSALGERIWALMPERYTRTRARPGEADDGRTGRCERGRSGPTIERWADAFAAREHLEANTLSERLRAKARPQLAARFGFLSLAFLNPAIAANFDPQAARDRRFLEQVADLDERKIESGGVQPLRFVSVVDPRLED